MSKPHLYRPTNILIWLNHFLPYIRSRLGLPADDRETVYYWQQKGIHPNMFNFSHKRTSKSICFGAGPHLENYQYLLDDILELDYLIISADGATRWLMKNNIYPHIVVTDLDGITSTDISELLLHDTEIQILTHGDNIPNVQKVINTLSTDEINQLMFATQGEPIGRWQNTLGFTDGDRAVSIATKYSSYTYMLGFDLYTDKIGKYSKPNFDQHQPITAKKQIKLEIADDILRWIQYNHKLFIDNYQLAPGIEISFDDFILL